MCSKNMINCKTTSGSIQDLLTGHILQGPHRIPPRALAGNGWPTILRRCHYSPESWLIPPDLETILQESHRITPRALDIPASGQHSAGIPENYGTTLTPCPVDPPNELFTLMFPGCIAS